MYGDRVRGQWESVFISTRRLLYKRKKAPYAYAKYYINIVDRVGVGGFFYFKIYKYDS